MGSSQAVQNRPAINATSPRLRARYTLALKLAIARLGWRVFVQGLLLLLLATPAAYAHVGSKDVFEQVAAGPYKLFITIRPPNVIPGVAQVEVRSGGAPLTSIHITPMPLVGEASKHPPAADLMKRSPDDPAFFTGGVWMMASGSWQVRFQVEGPSGTQTTSIPVPAVALSTLKMQPAMGFTLAALGLFLIASMGGVIAAAVREARLEPGAPVDPARRRRSLVAMAAGLAFMALLVYGGAHWWNVEAASYAEDIYRPMIGTASIQGDTLDLKVSSSNVDAQPHTRSNHDFLLDHGKPMHLYAIREPEMDAVFHLHPEVAEGGHFRMHLPSMPPGIYTLYGDVVHANGFPETIVTKMELPAPTSPTHLAPDDAEAFPGALSAGALGAVYHLPDGYSMVWDRSPAPLTANTAYSFHFRLLDPEGHPAHDMQPYLGMAGHAAFIKTDGTAFAHTHPEGSAAMAALDLANGPMSAMNDAPITPEVDFPYGFPSPGSYRIVIQMKHGATVETGVFDASVQ